MFRNLAGDPRTLVDAVAGAYSPSNRISSLKCNKQFIKHPEMRRWPEENVLFFAVGGSENLPTSHMPCLQEGAAGSGIQIPPAGSE